MPEKPRFPLFKLPVFIYEHIFSFIGPADLIEFSFCSKKCKNLIKSTKFPYTSISFSVTNNERIFVNLESRVRGKQMTWILKGRQFAVGRVRIRTIQGVQLNVFKSGPNCVCSSCETLSLAVLAVCQFLCELFRVPISKFILNPANIINFRPLLSLRNIQKLELNGNGLSNDDFQFLLENANASEKMIINMTSWNTLSHPNITFNCDKLIISKAFWTHKNTLLKSNCVHILLDQANFSSADCEEVIDKWINSDDRRLKSVQIKNRDTRIILENLNKYQLKRWDSTVRGRYFPTVTSPPRSTYIHAEITKQDMVAIDCSFGFDITRSDGLIATVMCTNQQFSFVVWHNRFPNVDGLRNVN